MFDSLTKSKFYTKCKSLTKMTKVRLDATRKKKNAVAKYLKNDIADLLRTGLDSNAYGRADGLIVEQNMIAAYKLMEEFCECILTNLAALDKQKECPKECREAIQSLMYAAARLAEFPELRDLRSLFAQRYGDCLELFLNKEFSELLNPRPASKEMKLQLLREVAQELSIKWDPKFLEQKLFRPTNSPSFHRHGSSNNADQDAGHKVKKSKDVASPRKDQDIRRESKHRHHEDDRRNSHGSAAAAAEVAGSPRRKEVVDDYRHNRLRINIESESPKDKDIRRESKYKHQEVAKRESHGSVAAKAEVADSPRRKDVVDDRHNRLRINSESDSTTDQDSSKQPSSITIGTTTTSASEDEVDSSKKPYYRFIPPPYVRVPVEKKEDVKITEWSPNSSSPATSGDKESESPSTKPRSVRRRQQMKELVVGDDNVESPLKLPPGRAYFGSADSNDGTLGKINNKAIFLNYKEDEEEERKLDELLMRHSKKRASYERGSNSNNMKSNNKLKPLSWRSRDESGKDGAPGSAPPFSSLGKSSSAAADDSAVAAASSSSGGGIGGRHGRSLSAESSTDVSKSKHVHPNLPDYDTLAARIAAFMRK